MNESKEYFQLESPEVNQNTSSSHAVELKFSVPWGHIAAKAWGDPRGQKILAVHGIQDSAATFDTLAPMLLQLVGRHLYIVSVDLPGHGFSSHLPPGIPYRFTDLYSSLRRVIAQLGWHRFHFMGHSLGGLMGYYLAGSYPDLVDKLIVIDAIAFRMYPLQHQPEMIRGFADRLLALEKKEGQRTKFATYKLDEILHKIAEGRGTNMSETGLKILASRNIRAIEGQENTYQFALDQRLKFFNFPIMHDEEAVQIMSNVKCQVLVISVTDKNPMHVAMLKSVEKNCSYFKLCVVEGDHDVHLNFPERVVPHVAKFLCEPSSSL